jgi:hypothetical protein
VIYQRRTSRHAAQVARSQLAVRLALGIYAAFSAAILLRCAVLALQFPDSVWTVKLILAVSAPVVFPFMLAPAAARIVFGSASLADITALVVLFAVPLLLIGRRKRGTSM